MLLTTLGQFAKEKKNPWGLWNAHGMFVDNINVPICKNKWNIIFGNLKCIHDNMKSTWHN